MSTLVIRIEYDGKSFSGWQCQPNTATIQGALESAFKSISGGKSPVVGAGRTDAGVHARGQVAHVRSEIGDRMPPEKIIKAMNANLPKDIRVNGAAVVKGEFHARFDATAREYSYSVIDKESVFLTRFATYFKYRFEPAKLFDSALVFEGEHDFTTFSKNNTDTKSYVCKVEVCRWAEIKPGLWRLRIKADRFVYGMVRAVVGAMYDVARGKRSIDEIRQALQTEDRNLSSPLAPPQGLILEKVYYNQELKFITV